jgi:tetratricopeptide (TPR) repeat protein
LGFSLLIQKETTAWANIDCKTWSDCWWHEPFILFSNPGYQMYFESVGWDSLNALFKNYFEPSARIPDRKVEWYDWNIRVDHNLAWVYYHEKITRMSRPNNIDSTREVKVAEKKNGQWKLAGVVAISKSSYDRAAKNVDLDLNYAAYKLISMKKYKEAISLLKMNVELYPDSYNVYDSLGEAYMLNGDKKLAIQNYKKSLELNPKNENAKKMIQKLAH